MRVRVLRACAWTQPQIGNDPQGKEDALRTAFIEIDRDGSGHLDPEELSECLARCGFRITKHQVLALARLLDADRSGAVDVQEFLQALGVAHA